MKLNDKLQEKLNKEARALKELSQIYVSYNDSMADQKKRKDEKIKLLCGGGFVECSVYIFL